MAIKLDAVPVAVVKTATKTPPLLPVDDNGSPAIVTHAGVKLAVVARDGQGPADYVLARFRPARPASADYAPAVAATDGRPAVAEVGTAPRPEAWVKTSKLADIQRAIKGKLIA